MPAQDYYSDAAPPPAAGPEPEEAPTTPETDTQEESQTAELPKAVLGGKEFKPGEEVVLEVVQVLENSVLVKYASEEGGEEAPPAESAPMPGGGNPGNPLYE